MGKEPAGDDDRVVAKADDVAESDEGRKGVNFKDDFCFFGKPGQGAYPGECQQLIPEADGNGHEFVGRSDNDTQNEYPGLFSSSFSADQDFSCCRGFWERELAVLLQAEIAAEGNEKENSQTSAQEGGEEDHEEVRPKSENKQGGNGKDGAADNSPGGSADRLDDDIFQDGVSP